MSHQVRKAAPVVLKLKLKLEAMQYHSADKHDSEVEEHSYRAPYLFDKLQCCVFVLRTAGPQLQYENTSVSLY